MYDGTRWSTHSKSAIEALDEEATNHPKPGVDHIDLYFGSKK